MQRIVLLLTLLCLSQLVFAQNVYTIKADSVKLTGCDSSELIIENHSQGVKGFLYNKGNGRTVFKPGLVKINDSLYLIGADSLRYNAWVQGGNAWGRTGILGTLDNNHLDLYTAGLQQGRLTKTGNWLLGTTRDTLGARLQVNGTTFFSDNVNVAISKQLNVGGINIVDYPSERYISCVNGYPMRITSGMGGYALFNGIAKLGSDSNVVFSPGGSVLPSLTVSSKTNSPSNTTLSFGNLRNDGIKKGIINTADYDASSLGGSTGIDLYVYPGKEIYSGSQGNIVMVHDGTNQRGNLMVGTTINNGSKLQVAGTSYLNGGLQVTGAAGGVATGFTHSRFFPTVDATPNTFDQTYGMIFSPTLNIHGTYQQSYAIAIIPKYNLFGNLQHTDAISPALYVGSRLGGMRIDQDSSYAGNSGQPLYIFQSGVSDKEAIFNARQNNATTRAFIWNRDSRPEATRENIIPMVRSTLGNPRAGGGVSLTLDRYYYGTEATIDMHYETTPDSTAHVNTSIAFYTMVERSWTNPLYLKGANVGMGTNTPAAQLHTTGTVRFAGLTNDSTQTRVLVSDANGNLYYRSVASLAANDILRSSLAVNGPVRAKSLILSPTGWADYVFDSTYRLAELSEVERYVREHRHLPGVAGADEVSRKGVDVGENQAVLLKKIEELTLYTIRQEKELESLRKEMEALRKMVIK